MKNKQRLDLLLVQQGLAETRTKAQALIMSGQVYVNNQKADKPGLPLRRMWSFPFGETPVLT